MDIKQTLQSKFPEVKDAFFEKEGTLLFLRIEVTFKTLDEVTLISRSISDYLDQNDPSEKEYFLDIYSSGTDQNIEITSLGEYIDKNVFIKLKKPIKSKGDFEGKIISVDFEQVIIKWNAKGQFRKQEIELSNIEAVNLAAKF